MTRALLLALALACGCATAVSDRKAAPLASRPDAFCDLIGTVNVSNAFDRRNGIVDEKEAMGPVTVIWYRQRNYDLLTTKDGRVYRCEQD